MEKNEIVSKESQGEYGFDKLVARYIDNTTNRIGMQINN